MKIEITQKQFEAMREALICAESALCVAVPGLKNENRQILSEFCEIQGRKVKSALAISTWDKVEVKLWDELEAK